MRVVVVVAAMLFCAPVFAQGVKLPSVTNSIGMELIEIPAGKFTMGSPAGEKDRQQEDEAQVPVSLTKPFGLGKTEVTQGQWKSVMGTQPWDGKNFVQADQDCPATYVSYFDAVEFCDTLTEVEHKAGKLKADEEYRLPTEAEWEYACRAGTTTAFSFGDESKVNAHAWWGGIDLEAFKKGELKAGGGSAAREQYAHKVGTKKPNPWGLHDMPGNVYEWCSDWHDDALSGGVDPSGPKGGSSRVFRGGSWGHSLGDCRSAARDGQDPSRRISYRGFRVARSQSAANPLDASTRQEEALQTTASPPAPSSAPSDSEARVSRFEAECDAVSFEILAAYRAVSNSPRDIVASVGEKLEELGGNPERRMSGRGISAGCARAAMTYLGYCGFLLLEAGARCAGQELPDGGMVGMMDSMLKETDERLRDKNDAEEYWTQLALVRASITLYADANTFNADFERQLIGGGAQPIVINEMQRMRRDIHGLLKAQYSAGVKYALGKYGAPPFTER